MRPDCKRETDVRIATPDDVLRWAGRNDLVIFFSEHFQRFRRTWHELNRRGCNTLYAIDGILEWRNAWENREDEPASPWTMRPVLLRQGRLHRALAGACAEPSGATPEKQNSSACPGWMIFPGQIKKPPTANSHFVCWSRLRNGPGLHPQQTELIVRSLKDLRSYLEATTEIGGRPIEIVWRLTRGLDETSRSGQPAERCVRQGIEGCSRWRGCRDHNPLHRHAGSHVK